MSLFIFDAGSIANWVIKFNKNKDNKDVKTLVHRKSFSYNSLNLNERGFVMTTVNLIMAKEKMAELNALKSKLIASIAVYNKPFEPEENQNLLSYFLDVVAHAMFKGNVAKDKQVSEKMLTAVEEAIEQLNVYIRYFYKQGGMSTTPESHLSTTNYGIFYSDKAINA